MISPFLDDVPKIPPVLREMHWRFCYAATPHFRPYKSMIEINAIQFRIDDLSSRVASLRGYL
jgi:hypothetical protein